MADTSLLVLDGQAVLERLDALSARVATLTARLAELSAPAPAAGPKYRRLSELADILGYTRSTLRPLIQAGVRAGLIHVISGGRTLNYHVADVEAYLSRIAKTGSPPPARSTK